MRKRRSPKERERLFHLHGKCCYLCGEPIVVGEAWELEHIIAWELTRDESDENVRPAHACCHKTKTANDVRAIRKADRQRRKHLGIKGKGQGFRQSKWKRKISGKVVLR